MQEPRRVGDTSGAPAPTLHLNAVSSATMAKPADTLATMEKTDYGNPATKSFRKQHIRLVTAAGTSALVHTSILNIAASFLQAAVDARPGMEFPAKVEAWQPLYEGQEPRPEHYGLALPASVADPDLAAAYGFTPAEGGRWYYFTADRDAAHEAAIQAETENVLALVGAEQNAQRDWFTGRPGERTPGIDDKGDDVHFFQLLYQCPDQDGVLNPFDESLILELQRRWGIEQTGTITEDTWRMLLPSRINFNVEYGDFGHPVKILQALLTAYDWTDGTLHITGRFDQQTGRAVANVQETYGLRTRPAVGAPEWAALIGRWPI